MTRINLSPEAARAVAASLKQSEIAFDAGEYDFFDEHDSQSAMMKEFEKRANDVRTLITRYRDFLMKDINELEKACATISLADSTASTLFKGGAGGTSAKGGGAR